MKNETWLKLATSKKREDLKDLISYNIGTVATDGHRLHFLKSENLAKGQESETLPGLVDGLVGSFETCRDIKLIIDKDSLKWHKIIKHFDNGTAIFLNIKNGEIWIERECRGSKKDYYGYDASLELKVYIGTCEDLTLDYCKSFSLSALHDAIKANKSNSINIRLNESITPLYLSYDDKIAIVCDTRI